MKNNKNKPVKKTVAPVPQPQAPPQPPAPDPRRQAEQRAAHQAEVLNKMVFPTMMSEAVEISQYINGSACRIYLERFLVDCGNPTDPVERMMLEQLALAHFRTGQLHAKAGITENAEAVKLLSAAAARLLGEFRRTALALRVYRAGAPVERATPLKLYKAAQ
jgi:hypothetical protein